MRKFNITGKIIPELHYYVDLAPQIRKLMALADEGTYFVINRPRQFGKTTVLDFFARRLQVSKDYVPALISFEDFTQRADITEADFYSEVADLIVEELDRDLANLPEVYKSAAAIKKRRAFFKWLRDLCEHWPQKLVLLIDEIDAAPETVVIGFLAGLRKMFLQRDRKPAPYAVCLAGVHDIKNLKARYRKETASIGSASPFNIAIDYKLPPFSLENIRQYFVQHTKETGQVFDEKVIARVHHVTNGHPWLVSVLAKTMVEDLVPNRRHRIQLDHAETAIQKLIASRNPNFESLFKNARNPRLLPVVLDLLTGKEREYNIQADNIDLGVKYGIFAEENQQLGIANRVYTQVLFKHFKEELEGWGVEKIVDRSELEDKRGRLDFRLVLDKFQAFLKAKADAVTKQPDFREATGQLLLLSYLDLLVNGKGWTFKEVRSGKGRIDVLCCYGKQKEIVEIKLWYGSRRYESGLAQLAKYLESESLDHGYLVVFDRREVSPKAYSFSEHEATGKKIFAWVM